ncbi:hypothetical protein [Streptomyces sp. NPDC013489]|uniref:hypothetical protein n=1 Tax=Streptomyces sp. NPDC013489 TaxID=3155606 RepID=UPI0033E745ED
MNEETDGETEVDNRTASSVEVGLNGQWRPASGPYGERAQALAQLEWSRALAAPAVSYRLIRETTTVTTTIEDT